MTAQPVAPLLDQGALVDLHSDQIGLDKGNMPSCLDQKRCKFIRVHAAVLRKRGTTFRRQAFHAGLNRNAPSLSEKPQHVRLPEVDSRLHAELHLSFGQRLKQRPLRQEYLVNEIKVADALRKQAIDLA